MVLLRFAPSPTGALHLGGLRTALFNYLYAKKLGGKWILRIEDTDAGRAVPGAVNGIRKALEWAGLNYDYGPGVEGPHAPYFQSERLDLYHSYAKKLVDSGHAYRCFCSQDRLATVREKLARSGSNNTYDKACLSLTEEEVRRRVKSGEKFVVRLNDSTPPDLSSAHDLIFGNVKLNHATIPTDPILLKSDLFPTYHLASVVDDWEMGITHVLRGEEWLPSLPLHLDLYTCLKLKPPQFAHLPLLLNPDGTKMSKRHGDVQVMDYQRRGWEPDAVLNWLALAGWGAKYEDGHTHEHDHKNHHHEHEGQKQPAIKPAPDSTTVFSLQEMVQEFDLSSLTHRRSVLDPFKLEYLNKHHLIREASTPEGLDKLAERVHGVIKSSFPPSQYTSVNYIKNVIPILQGRMVNINDIPTVAPYFFVEPDYESEETQTMLKKLPQDQYEPVLKSLHDRLSEDTTSSWTDLDLIGILHEEAKLLNMKTKVYMMILRYALTGMQAGPGVADILRVIGPERSVQRLKASLVAAQKA